VNKLLYIQINSRTLRRDALFQKLAEDDDEEEEDNLVIDEEEDAIFARPAHTEEALPESNSLAEGSQDESVRNTVYLSICRHFITVRFLLGF
jgi:hypothetical protein